MIGSRIKPPLCENCRSRFRDQLAVGDTANVAIRYLSTFSFCLACGWDNPSEHKQKVSPRRFSIELQNYLPAKEPVSHASKIVRVLQKLLNMQNIEIQAYGKNSIPLAKALAEELSKNIVTSVNPYVTKFARVSRGPGQRTLHCFIRFFEHVFDPLACFKEASISEGDLVYIESLDFQRCSDEGDFSYLWEKRVRYVLPVDYTKIFQDLRALEGGSIIISRTDVNEPIAGHLFEVRANPEPTKPVESNPKLPKFFSLSNTVANFQGLVRSLGDPIGVVGLGHKGVTLAHALHSLGKTEISFFDDNVPKVKILEREYEVLPMKTAKKITLLSTLGPRLSAHLFPSFRVSNELNYPLILSDGI